MKTTILVLAAVVGWSTIVLAQPRPPAAVSKLRFDVSFIPQAHDGPITGRVFVMVTRTVDKVPEPRLQIGRTGVPFFGRDVERLQPETIVSIDASDLGTPIDSIADIPAGERARAGGAGLLLGDQGGGSLPRYCPFPKSQPACRTFLLSQPNGRGAR